MKKLNHNLFFLILTSVLFSLTTVSCMTAKVEDPTTSIWDENVKLSNYITLYIKGSFPDIRFREKFENSLVEQFRTSGKNALSSYKIMPPLKEYSPEEEAEILKKNKVDLIIDVQISEDGMNYDVVVTSNTTNSSVGVYNSFFKQTATVGGGTTTQRTSVNTPFSIEISDVKSGAVIMRGLTNLYDAYTKYDTLAARVKSTFLTREFNEVYSLLKDEVLSGEDAANRMLEEGAKNDILGLRKPPIVSGTQYSIKKACTIKCDENGVFVKFVSKPENDPKGFVHFYSKDTDTYYYTILISPTDVDYVAGLVEQIFAKID